MSAKRYTKVQVEQGTAEWLEIRQSKMTASRAPALFPDECKLAPLTVFKEMTSPLKERGEGDQNPFFQAGHMAEEKARAYCRENLKLEFVPAVLVFNEEPDLLASLDGFVEESGIIFENKWTSKDDTFRAVEEGNISPDHFIQIQTQLLVSGGSLCHYFMVHQSGGVVHMEVTPDEAIQAEILRRTRQFMTNVRAGIAPARRSRKKAV